MNAPTLYTSRLKLRAFHSDDTADYARVIYKDPDVMRYMNAQGIVPRNPFLHAQSVIDRRYQEWNERGYSAWAVTLRETGELIGHVGLYVIENTTTVEVGYALGKPYWGKGYATEAASTALRFGFEVAELDEIVAVAFPQNMASVRVMEKIGMHYQGHTTAYYGLELALCTLSRVDYLAQVEAR